MLFPSSSTSSQVVCFSLLALRFFVTRSGSGSSILFRCSLEEESWLGETMVLSRPKQKRFFFICRSIGGLHKKSGILLLFDALNGSALSNRGGSIPPDGAGFDCFSSKDERFREERAMLGSRAV